MTGEVNHFTSLKEAKRAFGEIANDHGYKPSEINASPPSLATKRNAIVKRAKVQYRRSLIFLV
ncbi:MAG: hypothetical protein FJ242_06970 [Nitrospira sp.]|nr:hypothetical protein [Nitrospira sp.]